jgi:pyruvate dehydrogenase E2 component (dihydrolipoamide acetyltransferase)
MAEVIKMPRMSDTMTEGVIVSWLKKVGDTVKSGDVLAEVETDKATMELESYSDGTLLHIGVAEGQAVPVDGVIAVIGKQGEEFQSLLAGGAPAAEKPSDTPEAQPAEGKEAQPSNAEAPQTQPAAEKRPAAQKAASAQPVAEAQTTTAKPVETSTPATEEKPAAEAQPLAQQQPDGRIIASPLAKKIASDKGVPLAQVSGSGDQGRIVKRDVENFKPPVQAPTAQQAQTAPSSFASGKESFTDVPLSQMRKTIARRLTESMFGAPHFYLTIEINMDRAMDARKRINDFLGSKVSFNDIIIRTAAAALRKHPKVNGSWLEDKLRYYDHIHIGVAIAVEEGLVVPVIKFADAKSISQISQEVKDFAEKAKTKKLQPIDYEGNTFTISNLGMFGIEDFTAIINPPDACIMAVGAIQEKAVVINGEIKVGNMMKVTLSCDHRIVDGATGAQFLQTFKQYLEEPVIILA